MKPTVLTTCVTLAILLAALPCLAEEPVYYAQLSVSVLVPQRLVDSTMDALRFEDGMIGGVHTSGGVTKRLADKKTMMVWVTSGGFTEASYPLAKLQAAHALLLKTAAALPGAETPSAKLIVSAQSMAPRR